MGQVSGRNVLANVCHHRVLPVLRRFVILLSNDRRKPLTLDAVAYSGTLDIILALLPWFIIMRLTMTRREKFGVAFAMSMGVL
jgi:hypothetical protein